MINLKKHNSSLVNDHIAFRSRLLVVCLRGEKAIEYFANTALMNEKTRASGEKRVETHTNERFLLCQHDE